MSRKILGFEETNSLCIDSWQGNGRKTVIDELFRGRDLTAQLQILLRSPSSSDQKSSSAAVRERTLLADKLFTSITHALAILGSSESPADESHLDSPCSDLDSGNSRNRPLVENRRGANRKRKQSVLKTVFSPTVEDGHGWRKYGQKAILNAKHPRSYFRCTHQNDQGCEARKQAQRMECNSEMYKITYMGNHTCTQPSPIINIIDHADQDLPHTNSYYNICFSNSDHKRQCRPIRPAAAADENSTAGKEENLVSMEETSSGLTTDNLSSFDENEIDLWTGFEDLGNLPEPTSMPAADMSHHYFSFSFRNSESDF